MRARALTFSFLTSLSVLRQEHRFPNTLFLCSRTFSFALGPPRPPTLLFLFLSLSSPSQNLTLFLYVSCSGNGGWFNLCFEPGSPPRIGFARFALMFRQNELYKRKHTPKRATFDVTNRIWRTIQLCIRKRQATATIAKRRVTKRCSSKRVSCANSMKDRVTDQTQRTEDRLRSERKVRIANILPPLPLHLAKRLLIAPTDAKRIADIHKHAALFLRFPRIYTATRLINESTSIVQTTSRTPSSLFLSLFRISYDQESFSIRIDNQFGRRQVPFPIRKGFSYRESVSGCDDSYAESTRSANKPILSTAIPR